MTAVIRTALTLAVWTLALLLAPAVPAQAEQSNGEAQRVLVVFDAERGLPADVAQMVSLAGGDLLRVMPQVGLVVASGDAGFASRLEGTAHVQAVVPDEPVVASLGEPAAVDGPGTTAHGPTSARSSTSNGTCAPSMPTMPGRPAIAGAVHAADQGADVINVSLAIGLQRSCRTDDEPENVCAAILSALGRAATYARRRAL